MSRKNSWNAFLLKESSICLHEFAAPSIVIFNHVNKNDLLKIKF